MGSVSLAVRRGQRFERLYAVKRLLPEHRQHEEMQSMFLEEGRLAGLLHHPNVVSVTDVGQDHDGPFLVMDYIEGISARDLIVASRKEGVPLSVLLCCQVALGTAKGLAAAHNLSTRDGTSLELVHRDVSPHNVLIGFDGVVRLADFGIARAVDRDHKTSTGVLKGKVGYMAPEALKYQEPTPRSDLFALGVVFYELLSGRRLYAGTTLEKARRIVHEAPPDIGALRPDVPPSLQALLLSLLAKDPSHRPEHARAVVQHLERIVGGLRDDDPDFEMQAYVAQTFASKREERKRAIEAALQGLESTSAETSIEPAQPAPPPEPTSAPAPWPRWLIAGAALMIVLGVGVAATAFEPRPARITLSVSSDPPGAIVTAPTLPRMLTPTDIELAASDEPLLLRFEAEGYAATEERIVPRSDLQVRVHLVPETAVSEQVEEPREPALPEAPRPTEAAAMNDAPSMQPASTQPASTQPTSTAPRRARMRRRPRPAKRTPRIELFGD